MEGTLEIYVQSSNKWGTVCDDAFDANEGAVVCRQLGNQKGYDLVYNAHFHSAKYGTGSGAIH